MTNTFLTDSHEEVIVDFVKDHEELYDKTNELLKNKVRKDILRESQEIQTLCPGLQDMVQLPKDMLW